MVGSIPLSDLLLKGFASSQSEIPCFQPPNYCSLELWHFVAWHSQNTISLETNIKGIRIPEGLRMAVSTILLGFGAIASDSGGVLIEAWYSLHIPWDDHSGCWSHEGSKGSLGSITLQDEQGVATCGHNMHLPLSTLLHTSVSVLCLKDMSSWQHAHQNIA